MPVLNDGIGILVLRGFYFVIKAYNAIIFQKRLDNSQTL